MFTIPKIIIFMTCIDHEFDGVVKMTLLLYRHNESLYRLSTPVLNTVTTVTRGYIPISILTHTDQPRAQLPTAAPLLPLDSAATLGRTSFWKERNPLQSDVVSPQGIGETRTQPILMVI